MERMVQPQQPLEAPLVALADERVEAARVLEDVERLAVLRVLVGLRPQPRQRAPSDRAHALTRPSTCRWRPGTRRSSTRSDAEADQPAGGEAEQDRGRRHRQALLPVAVVELADAEDAEEDREHERDGRVLPRHDLAAAGRGAAHRAGAGAGPSLAPAAAVASVAPHLAQKRAESSSSCRIWDRTWGPPLPLGCG